MQREVFVVEKERFDLSDEKIYHLQGTWPKEHTGGAGTERGNHWR